MYLEIYIAQDATLADDHVVRAAESHYSLRHKTRVRPACCSLTDFYSAVLAPAQSPVDVNPYPRPSAGAHATCPSHHRLAVRLRNVHFRIRSLLCATPPRSVPCSVMHMVARPTRSHGDRWHIIHMDHDARAVCSGSEQFVNCSVHVGSMTLHLADPSACHGRLNGIAIIYTSAGFFRNQSC